MPRWWGRARSSPQRRTAAVGTAAPVHVVIAVCDDEARTLASSLARALAPGGGLAGGVTAGVTVVDARPGVGAAPGAPGIAPAGATEPAWPPGVAVRQTAGASVVEAWRAGLDAVEVDADGVVILVGGPVVAGRSTPFLEPLVAAVRDGAAVAMPVPQPVPPDPDPGPWRARPPSGVVVAVPARHRAVLAAVGDVAELCAGVLAEPGAEQVLVEAAYRTAPAADRPVAPAVAAAAARRPPAPGATPEPWRWAIRTSVGFGPRRDLWGDLHFARGLAAALRERGQRVVVDYRDSALRPSAAADDVVLLVRGPHRIDPVPVRDPPAASLLWVISHPDDVADDEVRSYDAVWAAGDAWARETASRCGTAIGVLPQCTDESRFDPRRGVPGTGPAVLFVGSVRDGVRPVVADALEAGLDVTVYGQGWDDVDHPRLHHGGTYLDNERLAAAYRGAGVVLNDHWPDMRAAGFWSNRLFDAAASGARVLTDAIAPDAALAATFHGLVRGYRTPEELRALVDGAASSWPDDAERARLGDAVRAAHGFGARSDVLLARVAELQST